MKPLFQPRPSREHLASQPLHVIIRDYPETLEEIRGWGILPEELGERTALELDPHEGLLDDLEALTAWRPGPAPA